MTVPYSLRTDVLTSIRVQPVKNVFGPNDSTARVLEVNSGAGMSLTKAVVVSGAIRPTLVPLRPRHGARSAAGTMAFDLQVGPHETLIEAAFRATFSAPLAAVVTGVTFSTATSLLSRPGGSWLTDGFRNGDTITLSAGTMIGRPLLITNVTTSTLLVVNLSDAVTMSATDVTVTRGQKVLMGAAAPVQREFSIEHFESINAKSERYINARVGSFGVNMPAEGAVTLEMGFVATDRVNPSPTSRFFTAAVADASPFLVTADAVISFAGARTLEVQALSMSWGLSVQAPIPVGSRSANNVFDGMTVPSLTLSFMRNGNGNLDAFEGETGPFDMAVMFREKGTRGGFGGYVTIAVPAFTLGSATIEDRIGESGPMIETVVLLLGPGTASNVDAALVTCTTSETA
jgi:hypothetical protein